MKNLHSRNSVQLQFNRINRNYHIGTATSIHEAIYRGLKKSRGIAFRGKTVPDPNDPREIYKRKHGISEHEFRQNRNPHYRPSNKNQFFSSRDNVEGRRESNGYIWRKIDLSHPQKSQYGSSQKISGIQRIRSWEPNSSVTKYLRETLKNDVDSELSGKKLDLNFFAHQGHANKRSCDDDIDQLKISRRTFPHDMNGKHLSFAPRTLENGPEVAINSRTTKERNQFGFSRGTSRVIDQYSKRGPHSESLIHQNTQGTLNSDSPVESGGNRFSLSLNQEQDLKTKSKDPSDVSQFFFPLSIPYTTSASEFLYGTSVIEALLTSNKTRRKLYKLYIYSSVYRKDTNRDELFQRLAESKGITVHRIDNDWIRLLDKMSQGRPHNGYILETSPLPRLPVKNLEKPVIHEDTEGKKHVGFTVKLDHQSHEEAAINGTSNFIQIEKSFQRKQPTVLLLDHILDPGNLGSIIRTASFFGISAIATSVRNCAALTPVVGKASAGTLESATILSVKNTVDFIVDSKEAGWYVIATVTPPQISDPLPVKHKMLSLSDVESLNDVSDSPRIIMIGSEGDGLRRTLHNKADLKVYIPRSLEASVDSLNVAVATGIICHTLSQKVQNNQSSFLSSDLELPLIPEIEGQQQISDSVKSQQ